jgi:hypothetical protein
MTTGELLNQIAGATEVKKHAISALVCRSERPLEQRGTSGEKASDGWRGLWLGGARFSGPGIISAARGHPIKPAYRDRELTVPEGPNLLVKW